MAALSKLSPFRVDMELSASLWLYLMAEFEVDHLERGKQRFPCYRIYASSGQMHRRYSSRKWIGSDDLRALPVLKCIPQY